MRQLIRRLRTCEAGSSVVEYGLLIAVLAVALVGILRVFRNTVGGITNRTAVTVSVQAAGAYGLAGLPDGGPSGSYVGYRPVSSDADSSSAEPDSSAAGGSAVATTEWKTP